MMGERLGTISHKAPGQALVEALISIQAWRVSSE